MEVCNGSVAKKEVWIEICYNGKWHSYMPFSVALLYVHTCIMVWDDESMRFANSISLFQDQLTPAHKCR